MLSRHPAVSPYITRLSPPHCLRPSLLTCFKVAYFAPPPSLYSFGSAS